MMLLGLDISHLVLELSLVTYCGDIMERFIFLRYINNPVTHFSDKNAIKKLFTGGDEPAVKK